MGHYNMAAYMIALVLSEISRQLYILRQIFIDGEDRKCFFFLIFNSYGIQIGDIAVPALIAGRLDLGLQYGSPSQTAGMHIGIEDRLSPCAC